MPDETDETDEARISALLASLRSPEAVPHDVAARLDHRLAELTAPRRRSWWRRHAAPLLVAAAALVVVGGIGTAVSKDLFSGSSSGSGSSASSTSAGSSVDRAPAAPSVLRRTSLRADVRAALRAQPPRALAAGTDCTGGARPAGVTRRLAVRLDGRTAVLDVYAARGGSRAARVVSCTGATLASTRVPAGAE